MSAAALPGQSPAPAAADAPPRTRPDELASRRVEPLLRPGRWVATAIALVIIAWLVYGLVANQHYDWGRFRYWFGASVILGGLRITLEVTGWSALFGLVGGIALAFARLSASPLLRALSWLYIWFFRSLPLIVLLLILYNFSYFYPTLSIGIPFGPSFAGAHTTTLFTSLFMGVLGLSLNESAYAAELVRGGILSVDHGQLEAAKALGLPPLRQLRRVILPQALRAIVPGYVNQMIGLIKSSSLVYYVSLIDVFGQVFLLESRYPTDVVPLLLVGAAWYLILTAILSVLQYYVERRFSRGAVRALPPTPLQKLRSGTAAAWAAARDLPARIADASAR